MYITLYLKRKFPSRFRVVVVNGMFINVVSVRVWTTQVSATTNMRPLPIGAGRSNGPSTYPAVDNYKARSSALQLISLIFQIIGPNYASTDPTNPSFPRHTYFCSEQLFPPRYSV